MLFSRIERDLLRESRKHRIVRILERAVTLWPEEAEYQAALDWA